VIFVANDSSSAKWRSTVGRKETRLNQVSEGSQSSPRDIASGFCMNLLSEILRSRHLGHKLIYLILKKMKIFLLYFRYMVCLILLFEMLYRVLTWAEGLTEDSASPPVKSGRLTTQNFSFRLLCVENTPCNVEWYDCEIVHLYYGPGV
jgi:hypothetical protein